MIEALREVGTGPLLLLRGFGLMLRAPRLLVLGALPAIITTMLLLGAIIGLAAGVGDLVTWATPVANEWSVGLRDTVRFAIGVAVVGGGLVVAVMMFAVVTLAIGAPFYERVAARIDAQLGGVPDGSEGSRGSLWDGLVPVLLSIGLGLGLFVVGLVPFVGTVAVAVLSAVVGGSLLATELIETAFSARGLGRAERRQAIRRRHLLALSFGVPTYLLCLVPLAAIVTMPAAVAGGTLLARELRGEPLQAA